MILFVWWDMGRVSKRWVLRKEVGRVRCEAWCWFIAFC
ncbi:unnamed protein product, partial [Brassica rapa]